MNFPIKTTNCSNCFWQPTQARTSCAIWFEALLSVSSTATIGLLDRPGPHKKLGAGKTPHLALGQTEPKRTPAREANAEVITQSSCRAGGWVPTASFNCETGCPHNKWYILDRLHLTTLKGRGSWNLIYRSRSMEYLGAQIMWIH